MESKKKITIHDIANRAKVSVSTVSRVLNATGPVAQDTHSAVMEAITALHYKPNLFAQGLASGQSMTVGVLTQLISSPFFDAILRGILDRLDSTRYLPLFADGNWQADKEQQAIETLHRRQVDGLIVVGGCVEEEYLVEVAKSRPLIVIARQLPSLPEQCLCLNNQHAAYIATSYLINCGHRRIAHIMGVQSHQDAVDRKNGYLKAMADAGIQVEPELMIEGDFTEASGVMAVEMLMTRNHMFSAVFVANDQMAYGARLAFFRRGIRVPEDVSIVGFDDQAPSAYLTPPLTSIQWPPVEIGKAAAGALLNMLQGKPPAIPDFPPRLVIRESVLRR
jgi:LacI family transcriptional regulator